LSITGQAITAGTVPVALGGTGATTASVARTNLGLGATDSPSFAGLTVGGASLSFTTLNVNTTLSVGNYIVNATGKELTLPATAALGNLITIYSPSYSYTLTDITTAGFKSIPANTVTLCIYAKDTTVTPNENKWVAYASGDPVVFEYSPTPLALG